MTAAPITNPFERAPEDVLLLLLAELSVQDLARFGTASLSSRRLVETVGYPAYMSRCFPGALDLPLSPPPPAWRSSSSLLRYLHVCSDIAFQKRSFSASALPLPVSRNPPPGRSHSSRLRPGLRSLMAKSARRIVIPSPTKPRSLVVYDYREVADGLYGEAQVEQIWEVMLPADAGVHGASSSSKPPARAALADPTAFSLSGHPVPIKGSGALLSAELTGLCFLPSEWRLPKAVGNGRGAADRPTDLLISFGNGVLQTVRLPQPAAGGKSKKKLQATSGAEVALISTLPHPATSIETMAVSLNHVVVTSLAGEVRTYSIEDVATSSIGLGSAVRPYAALRNEGGGYIAVGAAGRQPGTSLMLFDVTQADTGAGPRRSLLPARRDCASQSTPAVYALSVSESAPSLLLSGWSSPASSLCVHDLRAPSAHPAFSFTDRIADQPFYSCTSSFLGGAGPAHVMGGMGARGNVGIFDVRMAGRRDGGWTVFAPGTTGRQAGGSVGALQAEGGRLWGATPEAAFCIDFTLPPTQEEQEIARYYEHCGGRAA